MKANKIEKKILNLEKNLKEKIKILGPTEAGKIVGWGKQNMCAYIKGKIKLTYNKIIEFAKKFDL